MLQGHEGALQLLTAYSTAFPDFRLIIDDLLADGENVTLRWTFTGTHNGSFGALRASGKSVSVPGIAIFQITGSKAKEVRMVCDKYALMQQIGALASQAAS